MQLRWRNAEIVFVTAYFKTFFPSDALCNFCFSLLQLTCTNSRIPVDHIWMRWICWKKIRRLWHFTDDWTFFIYPQSTPCKHPVIVLQDVAFTDLHALVEFIYHGEVNVHQRSLSSFLKTAEVLRVSGLTQQQAEETHNVSQWLSFFHPIVISILIQLAASSSTKFGSKWRQNSNESSSKFHW